VAHAFGGGADFLVLGVGGDASFNSHLY